MGADFHAQLHSHDHHQQDCCQCQGGHHTACHLILENAIGHSTHFLFYAVLLSFVVFLSFFDAVRIRGDWDLPTTIVPSGYPRLASRREYKARSQMLG